MVMVMSKGAQGCVRVVDVDSGHAQQLGQVPSD